MFISHKCTRSLRSGILSQSGQRERERGAFDLERLGRERAIKGGDVASADGAGDTV